MLDAIKKAFSPMEDDMSSTKHHIKQIERSTHWDYREPLEDEVRPAHPGFIVDVNDNGPVTLNLHIGE